MRSILYDEDDGGVPPSTAPTTAPKIQRGKARLSIDSEEDSEEFGNSILFDEIPNFFKALMTDYPEGKITRIARAEQFEKIVKLMDSYYGFNEPELPEREDIIK